MNHAIKEYARISGVKLWEVADMMGIKDSNFSKMLRYQLTSEKENEIIKIIDRISEDHRRKDKND